MKAQTAFTLIVGVILTIAIFGAFAQVYYTAQVGPYSVTIKKVTLNLNGYDPWHIMAKPAGAEGSLLNFLAYSWYTSNPSSGGTAISSFSLTLSGISASGQYVKASSGAALNTANLTVQIYSKPYNNSAWVLDGSNTWTDEPLPVSISSWTSPSYSLTPLNGTGAGPNVSGAILAVPITISNSQSSATPAPFQELISINPSLYTSYEASNLGNIRFYFQNGTELYAWLESYNSTNANIWVKLPNGLGADSSVKIWMVFLSTSTNFDGNYWGEAPELSPTYGEYDNGQNVFNAYWDFKGTSLPSGLATTYSGTASVDNSLFLSGSSGTAGNVYTASSFTAPQVLEAFLYKIAASGSLDVAVVGEATSTTVDTSAGYGDLDYSYFFEQESASPYSGIFYTQGSGSGISWVSYNTNMGYPTGIYGIVWVKNGLEYAYMNYTKYTFSGTSTAVSWSSTQYAYLSSNIGTADYYWMRLRAYPPNGVMPTAVVGSIPGSNQQYDYAIKLTVSGLNAITGAPMSASTWLNISSNLYWEGNVFKADIFSISGMAPTITLPMYAIELLILLWIGIIIVAKRVSAEMD